MPSRPHLGLALLLAAIAASGGACTCSKGSEPAAADAGAATEPLAEASTASVDTAEAGPSGGLSAPIAAARSENGDVIVAALDVGAHAIRVQRIGPNDEIKVDRTIFDGAAWSSESDLKVFA